MIVISLNCKKHSDVVAIWWESFIYLQKCFHNLHFYININFEKYTLCNVTLFLYDGQWQNLEPHFLWKII